MFKLCRNGLLVLADTTTLCSMVSAEGSATGHSPYVTAAVGVVAIVGMIVWTNECGSAWFRSLAEGAGPEE
jgi:hypothetical protein